MPSLRRLVGGIAAAVPLTAAPLRAQAARATPPAAAAPVSVASVRGATGQLRLDGVLEDAAWAQADSITDFTQRDPAEGQPASERTVVRLLAAADGLWIGPASATRNSGATRSSTPTMRSRSCSHPWRTVGRPSSSA